jgi:hypothetical protein
MPGGALEAEAVVVNENPEVEMDPWIAEQANREHIAELRSLGRPLRLPLAGRGIGRHWGVRAGSKGTVPTVGHHRRRVTVRF